MSSPKEGWVYTTTPTVPLAHQISQLLIKKKLVACVNIIPSITSFYEEKGQVQEYSETAIMLKTRSSLFDQIQKEIEVMHDFECPCIVFIPFTQISSSFSKWIHQKTPYK